METLKTMTCRKSVRSYKNTLSDADLQKILLSAQAAPIGMGKYDTMHMTVIRNAELLQELDRNAAEFFGSVSLLSVVVFNRSFSLTSVRKYTFSSSPSRSITR